MIKFKTLLPAKINLEQNFALLSDPKKVRKLGGHPLLSVLKSSRYVIFPLLIVTPIAAVMGVDLLVVVLGWSLFLLMCCGVEPYCYAWVGVDDDAFQYSFKKNINNELKVNLIEKFEQNKQYIDPAVYAKLSHLIAHDELSDLWWGYLSIAMSDVQKKFQQPLLEAPQVSPEEMEILLAQKRKGLAQLSLEKDKSSRLSSVVLSTEKIDIDPWA